MAQPDDSSVTPEKRLLELIEEPDAQKKEAAAGTDPTGPAKRFSSAELKDKVERFKERMGGLLKKYQKTVGMKELNRYLTYIVVVLSVVFVVDFLIGLMGLSKDFASSVKVQPHKDLELALPDGAVSETPSVSDWDVAKMFVPYGKRLAEAQKIEKEQSTRLVGLTKNLKLTGISYNPSDPKSAFCMIEDVEKNITTFLHEGDPIGLLKVQKILEDRVVLSQENDTVEIR